MEYTIYKDTTVELTVDRIKKILDELGIEIEEQIHQYPIQDKKMPASVRLFFCGLKNLNCANGKGTTLQNAKASAYSEFLERLQNCHVIFLKNNKPDFFFSPDEKFLDTTNYDFFKNIYDLECIDYIGKIESYDIHFVTTPFYNIRQKKLYDIPICIILNIQGSTGMCAGNTPEEAIVQGLSEIYERYSIRQIILNNISMPDIPEEVWGKYDRIKELKEYVELYGYEVFIKDASLGENLPVACTLFRHKEKGYFGINFGAQPSLPVAIERTLTEFMQAGLNNYDGRLINVENKNCLDRYYVYTNIGNSMTLLPLNNKDLYEQFFVNQPTYQFSFSPWINMEEKYTNKELLEFLIKNVNVVQDKQIYVRDVSFLGFPSYYIYIPTISEMYFRDKERLKKEYCFRKCIDYLESFCLENLDIDTLISALKFKTDYLNYNTDNIIISPLANEYLLLLCYIVKGEIPVIIKYCEEIINNSDIIKNGRTFEIIRDYFTIKEESPNADIIQKLKEKYAETEITEIKNFIKYMDFNGIKRIIYESRMQYEEDQRINNLKKKNEQEYIPHKDYGNINYKLEQARKKIAEKYKNNIPDQMELSKVFDFI